MSSVRTQLVCPGCGGSKSRRALLCASCRRRASIAGVEVVVERIASKQISAFHAIANHIDKLHGVALGTTKARVKRELGIGSLKSLSYQQASDLLDQLDDERTATILENRD